MPNTFTDNEVWAILIIGVLLVILSFFVGLSAGLDDTEKLEDRQRDILDIVKDLEIGLTPPSWASPMVSNIDSVYRKTFGMHPFTPVTPPPLVTEPSMSDYYNPSYWERRMMIERIEKKPTVEGRLNKIERDLYEKPILRQDQV